MAKDATIQYRYLNTDKAGDHFDLKSVVVDVLRRTAKDSTETRASLVRHRKMDLDQDGSYVVLNKMNDASHWDRSVFCGQILHIRAGADVAGIIQSLEEDIPELELQNITMGDDQRVVDGVLYFAIFGNHVGLIEGQRARSRTLERFLTEMLQEAGELEIGQPIILNSKLGGSCALDSVNELIVTPAKGLASAAVDTVLESGAGQAAGEGHTVFDVLETLGWSTDEITGLRSNLPPDGWIEGTFKMAFKRKGKRRATKAEIARSQLEEALRNHHPATFGLSGPSGTEKGGLTKLAERRKVQTVGELLDPEDAMHRIVDLLRSWSINGKIDCDFR